MSRTFTEHVQSSGVKHPTQRGFSLREWKSAFQSFGNPSENDQRVYAAGIWFFRRFESIRKKLLPFATRDSSKARTIRTYVGYANYLLCLNEGTLPPLEYVEHQEHLIDSMRYTLALAMTQRDPAQQIAPESLKSIVVNVRLARLYDTLESLWSRCLWAGWYIDESRVYDLIRPNDIAFEQREVAAMRRYDELLLQYSSMGEAYWTTLDEEKRLAILSEPKVVAISRDGKKKTLKVGSKFDKTDGPPPETNIQVAAEELYFNDILTQPLTGLLGLTIRDLLFAWRAIAPISSLCTSKFPQVDRIENDGQLLNFSPVFTKRSITKAIVDSTGFQTDRAAAIVDLLTFSSTPRDDIWRKPFVPIDPTNVTLLIHVLRSPNLVRMIEFWMKIGGIDLGARGKLFEEFVRAELNNGPNIVGAKTRRDSVNVVTNTGNEEIDLVIKIGNSFIIGELKCTIHPGSHAETGTFFHVLSDAAIQVKRKVSFINSHVGEFLQAVDEVADLNRMKLIPLVVTNCPLGVGLSFHDVPVVDLLILQKYLDEGRLETWVLMNKRGGNKVGKVVKFYEAVGEAESNIQQYLSRPPQIEIFLEQTKVDVYPLMMLNEDEKPARFTKMSVNLPFAFLPESQSVNVESASKGPQA